MLIKPIKFDLNKYRLYEKLKAKQGDTESRFLLFQLLDGSLPFNLENRSVRAYMIKPDGKEVFNDLIINDRVKGYCTLELTNQVLAAPGIVKLELMVTEGTKKLTSSVFELEVDKSINSEKSIVSTNEFGALLKGLASLNEYDNYKNEIAEARDGEKNLLTKVKKIDEQLDTIENEIDKNYNTINNKLANKLGDGVSVKMGDLSNEVKEAMTGGSVAVVGKNSVGKENIIAKNVEINHTTFFKQGEINLCLYTTFEQNKGVSPTTGGLMDLSGYKTTDYIEVEANTTYSTNEYLNVAFYNSSKTWIGGLQGGSWYGNFTTPSETKYLKISFTSTTNAILNKGSVLNTNSDVEITNSKLDSRLIKYVRDNVKEAIFRENKRFINSSKLEFITDTDYVNLYNPSTSTTDKSVSPTNGNLVSNVGYSASDYIYIYGDTKYYASQQNHLAFYDIDKKYISGLSSWTNPLTTPSNAKYIRVTFTSNALNPYITKNTAKPYVSYGKKYFEFESDFIECLQKLINGNELNNISWNALGDSITEGPNYLNFKSYAYYLTQKYNMNTVNYGVSSSRIAKSSARTDSFIERYLNMRDNVNIVSVKGGTNDFLESTPMGSFSSTSETEFYGALHILCKGLKEKYYNIPIFFMTPIINSNKSTNSLGFKLTDYCKAIKEVCAYYGIPVLDLNSLCQIDPTITNIKNNYITDGVHPNDNGHILYIMPLVEDYMKKLL